MRTQKDLDEQLRLANGVPAGSADSDEFRSLLDEIGAQIVASGPPPKDYRRRRFSLPIARRGVVLASVIGTVVAGGAAAATAVILTSNTVGAPGFCQTVLSETADVQFPSGDQAWQNWALLQSVAPPLGATLHQLCDTPAGAHMADDAYPGSFVIPPISEKVQFTMAAFCAWTDEWLTAQSDGDTASASQAASEIADAQQWPSTQEIEQPGSGVGPQQLAWFVPVQQAVQAENVSEVAATFVYYPKGTTPDSECLTAQPPADSDNGTVYVRPSE